MDGLKAELYRDSYFGKQDGDFSQDLQSISARKYVAGDKQRTMSGRR